MLKRLRRIFSARTASKGALATMCCRRVDRKTLVAYWLRDHCIVAWQRCSAYIKRTWPRLVVLL